MIFNLLAKTQEEHCMRPCCFILTITNLVMVLLLLTQNCPNYWFSTIMSMSYLILCDKDIINMTKIKVHTED